MTQRYRSILWLFRRGSHYGLLVCATGFALFAVAGLFDGERAVSITVTLATLFVIIVGGVADGLHAPRRCDRCAELFPYDAGRMITTSEERWKRTMRDGHYIPPVALVVLMAFMVLSTVAVVNAWYAMNIVALIASAVLAIWAAVVRMRHRRYQRWCPACQAGLISRRDVLRIRLADVESQIFPPRKVE